MDISDLLETVTLKKRRTPVFKHGSSEAQYSLAFPKFIIDYLIANPSSPKQWKKLIKTCKYWFDKNPIVVIQCLHFNSYAAFGQPVGWATCSSVICNDNPDIGISFAKPIKLWVTGELTAESAKFSASLIPHLFKCDAKKMVLYCDVLNAAELALLTSNLDEIIIYGLQEINEKFISFEEIVESLPASLERIEFYFHEGNWTPDTFKKVAKMENVRKFKRIDLAGNISRSFDYESLFKFMLENKQIYFDFNAQIQPYFKKYVGQFKNAAKKIQKEKYGAYQRPSILLNGVSLVKND